MRLALLVTLCASHVAAFGSISSTKSIVRYGGWISPCSHRFHHGAATKNNNNNHNCSGLKNHAKVQPNVLFATVDTSSSSRSSTNAAPDSGFIATELRGAAMRLHTTRQAPKEGEVMEKTPVEPYVPTREDYLFFLVDSKHVYEALEDVVNQTDELSQFRNTGLERTTPLEIDIEFMVAEYGLKRPEVGVFGKKYAEHLRSIKSIPEFMCHYYNFYFAHTAGGRMIGKQMSALLLYRKTLEFYKWDGDLNEIKSEVKCKIEAMAAQWTRAEKDSCVSGTASAFQGGGGINAYLSGGSTGH